MFKKRIWLGTILSIILLVFSMNGFTAYYKYTQESGDNFYVGIDDKADALENTNEMRQIIDDLGALLAHSKRDGVYPEGGDFGGTIQIPEVGLKFSNDPIDDDIAAYIAGEMAWQTKAELGLLTSESDPNVDTQGEIETILTYGLDDTAGDGDTNKLWSANKIYDELAALTYSDVGAEQADAGLTNLAGLTYASPSFIKVTATDTYAIRTYAEVKADLDLEIGTDLLAQQTIGIADDNLVEIDDTDAAVDDYCKLTADGIVGRSYSEVKTDLDIDLSLYYLKTAIDELSEVETIYTKDIIDSDELAAALGAYYLKTAIDTIGKVEAIWVKDIIDSDELAALTYSDVGAEQADAGLTSLAGLTYVSPSFIKATANDTYVFRTIAEVITDLALSSADLSDVDSIGMLDEDEKVTGFWDFSRYIYIERHSDTPTTAPTVYLRRYRATGEPIEDDYLGRVVFRSYRPASSVHGAIIQAIIDGTPGDDDMPGRLEFLTTPDGSDTPVLRATIDSTGRMDMEVSGGGYYDPSDDDWHVGTSLRETKTNITNFQLNAIDLLRDIEIKKYQYKDVKAVMIDVLDEEGNPVLNEEGIPIKIKKKDEKGEVIVEYFEPSKDKSYAVGYIVEELPQGLIGEVINEQGNMGIKGSFSYLILVCQEQQKLIDELKLRIEKLEKK